MPRAVLLPVLFVTNFAAGGQACAGDCLKVEATDLLQHDASALTSQERLAGRGPAGAGNGTVSHHAMQAHLKAAMEAQSDEALQSSVRNYLRETFDLQTGQQKLEAVQSLVGALSSRVAPPEEPMDSSELTAEDVQQWLEDEFLDEALYEHATMLKSMSSKGESVPDDMAVPKCLASRPEVPRVLPDCSWLEALAVWAQTGAKYGNFCGRADGTLTSYGRCTGPTAVPSGVGGLLACADSGLDSACARHDAGTYSEPFIFGARKCLCQVDRDFKYLRMRLGDGSLFKDSEGNTERDALKGANCLFNLVPCKWYGEKRVLQWCGLGPCYKTVTKYHTVYSWGDPPAGGCPPGGCYSVAVPPLNGPFYGGP